MEALQEGAQTALLGTEKALVRDFKSALTSFSELLLVEEELMTETRQLDLELYKDRGGGSIVRGNGESPLE